MQTDNTTPYNKIILKFDKKKKPALGFANIWWEHKCLKPDKEVVFTEYERRTSGSVAWRLGTRSRAKPALGGVIPLLTHTWSNSHCHYVVISLVFIHII